MSGSGLLLIRSGTLMAPCSRTISNVHSDSWSVISGQYIFSGPSISVRLDMDDSPRFNWLAKTNEKK